MFEDINNKIYSSPHNIYIERIDKSLRQFLESKTESISRAGKDILIRIEPAGLKNILAVLKENPEFSIDVLKNIKTIWDDRTGYLLCELTAAGHEYSILLKVILSEKTAFREIIEKIREYYHIPDYFIPKKDSEDIEYNFYIPGTMLRSCSNLDLKLALKEDIIQDISIDSRSAKVLKRDFFKGLQTQQIVGYMGRFDYNAGIFGELAFCRGIEELLQLEIPKRAKNLRILMSELFRITSHLDSMSRLAEVLGHDIAVNMIMIERERLLGIIESVTGARILPNFIRIGGVNSRVGSDIIKKIKRTLVIFMKNFRRIGNLFITDFILVEKLKNLGIIDKNLAEKTGLTGPNLRASGSKFDLRKEPDQGIYHDIHFTVPYARGGSCMDRLSVRIGEIYQSVRIIRQVLNKIPAGPVLKKINLAHLDFKHTPFISSVECPHGIFKIYGEVEGNSLRTFSVLGPSGPALSIAGDLIKGNRINDIEVIIASLDISGGEILDYI